MEAIHELFSAGVIAAFADIFTLGGIVALMLYLDWRLALVSFAAVPLLSALVLLYRGPMREAFRDVRARLARLNGCLQEDVVGMDVVQAHLAEGERFERFDAINRSHREACLRSIRYDAILFSAVEAGGSVAIALVLWQGAAAIVGGTLTLGVLAAFIEYIAKFFAPLKDLSAKYTLVQSALASSERILELLGTEPEVLPPLRPRPLPRAGGHAPPSGEPALSSPSRLLGLQRSGPPRSGPVAGGHVAFEGVSFTYNSTDGDAEKRPAPAPALHRVSFEARPGEVVALVGATGAGKTTAIKLLARLYDPQEGRILLDGADIRELDLKDLRRAVGVVMQEPFLFTGDVAGNIRLGDGPL
ncbi:MAG: ABC transporter ATP-binding protein, partial [Nitrospinota bacterium]